MLSSTGGDYFSQARTFSSIKTEPDLKLENYFYNFAVEGMI